MSIRQPARQPTCYWRALIEQALDTGASIWRSSGHGPPPPPPHRNDAGTHATPDRWRGFTAGDVLPWATAAACFRASMNRGRTGPGTHHQARHRRVSTSPPSPCVTRRPSAELPILLSAQPAAARQLWIDLPSARPSATASSSALCRRLRHWAVTSVWSMSASRCAASASCAMSASTTSRSARPSSAALTRTRATRPSCAAWPPSPTPWACRSLQRGHHAHRSRATRRARFRRAHRAGHPRLIVACQRNTPPRRGVF